MTHITRMFVLGLLIVLAAACSPTPTILPTEIASITPPAPTATVTPTRTPFPTATATIPAPRMTSDNPQDQAYVRFINASALGTVNFYVDAFNFAGFMDATTFTDQVGLAAGQYSLSAVATDPDDLTAPLAQTSLTLLGGESVIVILNGTADNPRLTLVREDLSPISGDKFRVTLFNALSDGALSLNNGSTVLNTDTTVGTASLTTLVPAGQIALNIRRDGQIIYADEIQLRSRQNTTIVVLSGATAEDVELLVLNTPIVGITEVRFVNAIFGLPVDIVADDIDLAAGIGDLVVTNPQTLAARDYEIVIYATGADRAVTEPLYRTNLNLNPDKSVYLIVVGTADNVRLLTYTLDTSPTETGTARIAFINTLSDIQRMRVTSNVALENVVGYGQIDDAVVVPAGALPLVWSRYQGGEAVGENIEQYPDFALQEGTDTLYFVTGRAEQPPFIITNPVGTVAPDIVSLEPTATPNQAPSLYAINALEGLTIQFRVDDVELGAVLAPRSSGTGSLIPPGEHTFTALRTDTNELLARQTLTTNANLQYTLVMLERSGSQYDLIVLESPPVASADPTVRLINLSELSIALGLAVVANNGSTLAFPDLNAPIDTATGSIPYRISYPIGLTRVISDINSAFGSTIAPIRFGADVYDLYIVDDTESSIANITPAVTLENNRHYDIIAYQSPFTRQVSVYVLPAPLSLP